MILYTPLRLYNFQEMQVDSLIKKHGKDSAEGEDNTDKIIENLKDKYTKLLLSPINIQDRQTKKSDIKCVNNEKTGLPS